MKLPKWDLPDLQLAVRASIAAALSLLLADFLDLQFPIYAFIAAVIVTDLEPGQTRELGARRIASTVIGAATGAALSMLLPPGPLTIGASIFIAMMLANLMPVRGGAKVAGYICGIVLLDHSSQPWLYAAHRLAETLIGVAVAWGISYVPKLIASGKG
jgi:uncharacterized membrane protein YgaE (UPF0421/DUF939 family)